MPRPALLALSLLTLLPVASPTLGREPDGGGSAPLPTESLSPATYERIRWQTRENEKLLNSLGRLTPPRLPEMTLFSWPLQARELGYHGYHGISYYVDQDTEFPEKLLDYDCGQRTYDDASGYNHRGTDIFAWPFAWLLMDESKVEVVAPAAGTIVNKADGNPDRNCSCATDNPNFVVLQHADGSESWYLHLKQSSVTTRSIGDVVAAGEYIGVIGSSGCSSVPHLHFEVYDQAGALADPFSGSCNSFNSESWWQSQPPYRDSAINALATHDAPPDFPPCPEQEIPHFRRLFASGETLLTAIYLRDEVAGSVKNFWILDPSGATWASDTHSAPDTYDASYWYWTWTLPASGATGRWVFRVEYEGTTLDRAFWVDAIFADDFEDASLDAWSSLVL